MKTFILKWRPLISSYKMEQFEEEMHYIEYGEFNWSVHEWEKARSGDNFYMVKVGEGRTGIVMKGFFTSAPYEAADWSDKNRVSGNFASAEIGSFSFGRNRQN